MADAHFFHRTVAGERGFGQALLRVLFGAIEPVYSLIVRWRNHKYDRDGPAYRSPVPVISVGNLTVGGTGKTPVVIEVVKMLEKRGRAVAVVSRGYGKRKGEANDEELVVRRHCPAATYVSDPDREAACRRAVREMGADVLVMDDGFQHRRVGRDSDVVVIDATNPFGHGHLLPRGLLREPVASLNRANLIILTRCDQVARAQLEQLEDRLRQIVGDITIAKCVHKVTAYERLDGSRVEQLPEGRKATVFAGIGRPTAFLATVQSQGIDVVGHRWWPDHHDYRMGDLTALRRTSKPQCEWLVTTEKDAVKLARLDGLSDWPIIVVKVSIDFLHGSDTMLSAELDRIIDRSKSS